MGRSLLWAISLAAFAGCGSEGQGPGMQMATQVATALVARAAGGGGAAGADPLQSLALTRAEIDAAGVPVLLVVLADRGAAASLTAAGQNGDKITWLSADGQSVTTRDGLVIATRALGDDMMGLDAPGGIAGIRSAAAHQRTYEFLGGEDQIIRVPVTCQSAGAGAEVLTLYDQTFATTKIVETCTYETLNFQNSYWFDAQSGLRKSVQWVSFGVGQMETIRP